MADNETVLVYVVSPQVVLNVSVAVCAPTFVGENDISRSAAPAVKVTPYGCAPGSVNAAASVPLIEAVIAEGVHPPNPIW